MSENKSKLSRIITDIKYSIALKREAKKEERRLKKIRRTRMLKSLFSKEERLKRKKNKVKALLSDQIFNIINGVVMVLLVLLIVIPLLYLIANAFSDGAAKHEVLFLPKIIDSEGLINYINAK